MAAMAPKGFQQLTKKVTPKIKGGRKYRSTYIKKKRHGFFRHQSDTAIRVKPSWRRPKGIDSCVRRKFRGKIKMPNIGYGTDKKYKYKLPNGLFPFMVRSPQDLNAMFMCNKTHCAIISRKIGSKKRMELIKKAKALEVKVLNENAKVETRDNE